MKRSALKWNTWAELFSGPPTAAGENLPDTFRYDVTRLPAPETLRAVQVNIFKREFVFAVNFGESPELWEGKILAPGGMSFRA